MRRLAPLILLNTLGGNTYDYYAMLPPGIVPQGIILHEAGLLKRFAGWFGRIFGKD